MSLFFAQFNTYIRKMSLESIYPKLEESEKEYLKELIANLGRSVVKSHKLSCENGNLKKFQKEHEKHLNEVTKEKCALQRKHRLLNVEMSKVTFLYLIIVIRESNLASE